MRGILAIVIALVAMAPLVYAIDVSMSCDSGGCILPGGCVDTRPPLPPIIIMEDDDLVQIYDPPNESLNSDPASIGVYEKTKGWEGQLLERLRTHFHIHPIIP